MKPAFHNLYRPLPGKYRLLPHSLSSPLRRTGSLRGSLLERSGRWRDFLLLISPFHRLPSTKFFLLTPEKFSHQTFVREENIVFLVRGGLKLKRDRCHPCLSKKPAGLASQRGPLCVTKSVKILLVIFSIDQRRGRKQSIGEHCDNRKCLGYGFSCCAL